MNKTKFTGLLALVVATALLPMSNALAVSQLMDYVKPTPIVGSLSTTAWGVSTVGARDQSNGLEDKTLAQYVYWDGGIIKAPDGVYHMFGSRWSSLSTGGHYDWGSSVAIHATSNNLYGPYTDQGMIWPDDQGGLGHNVFPLKLKDGRYGIVASETRRPAIMYIADNLNGPWTKQSNMQIAAGANSDKFTMSNVAIVLRPDGKYQAIQRDGVLAIADEFVGPYVVQGPGPLWNSVSGLPTENMEDPVMWYSGGLYHITVNKWDTSKAFHLTSEDGVNNWKLQPGYAYDPTADFIRYTNGQVNHWTKLERPNVYIENGHVVAMTFAAIDVQKWDDHGGDQHGNKIIVMPFDGAALDADLNPVINPGFETDGATQTPTGWSTSSWSGSAAADYTETNGGAKSGTYHLTHYNGQSGSWNVYTYQNFTGLANGTYTLSAWALKSGNGFTASQMEAKNFGSNTVAVNIPTSSTYQKVTIPNINVTNGQCTIGFWTQVDNGSNYPYVFMDDVSFTKN